MSKLKFISKSILILSILIIGGIGVQTCSNDHPAIDFDTPWLDVSAESSSSAEEPSSSSAIPSSSSIEVSSSSSESSSSSVEASSSSVESSSSSVEASSSSDEQSSSSVEPSSSSEVPSSSSVAPSSSSAVSSSSSVVLSSSSVAVSSSSVEPSSSSVVASSSSVEPSSSSVVPSSSSVAPSSSSAALCDGKTYDSEMQFCHSNELYDKCGDVNGLGKHEYNPATHFCFNNHTVAKCGVREWNPHEQNCNMGIIEEKCGNNWYNPAVRGCCNFSNLYLLSTQFCHDNTQILNKCGNVPTGATYNPNTEACCGTGKYTVATEFCSRGNVEKIISRCGGLAYNGKTHFCHNSVIVEKCDGKEYSPNTHFCYNNEAYSKCGGTVEYIPETEACCGNSKYTIATQECGAGLCAIPYEKTRTHYGKSKFQFCDERDGQKYVYVTIGTQTWMAENLNFNADGSRCYGDNTGGDSQNRCVTYGRLYNWATALTVCPSGWHLPSDAEWTVLTNHVGTTPGTKLKASSGWNSGGNGTDDFGFSALPGGYGGSSGSFNDVGNYGFWWSTTEYSASRAWGWYMRSGYSVVYENNYDKSMLVSVRCVRD